MLRVYEAMSDLYEAEHETSGSVYLLPIHYSIRHEIQGAFPEAKCTVLGYPAGAPTLWLLIRRNLFSRPHVFMASRTQLFVSDEHIDTFLVQALPFLLELAEFHTRIIGIQLSTRFSELLSSHFDFTAPSYLSSYFIVNELKQRQISNMDIQLTDGYYFAELDADRDADSVAGTWKFSSSGDRDQFAAKIRRMPSIAIKSFEGDLASFTVLDASGFFNNQYTFMEHRQRGLANRSELRLCQKVMDFGLHPIKFVEHENAAVLARSMKSPWWSTVVDEAGVPVVNDHRLVYRRDPPSATIIDEEEDEDEDF